MDYCAVRSELYFLKTMDVSTALMLAGGGLYLGISVPAVCTNYLHTGSWCSPGFCGELVAVLSLHAPQLKNISSSSFIVPYIMMGSMVDKRQWKQSRAPVRP